MSAPRPPKEQEQKEHDESEAAKYATFLGITNLETLTNEQIDEASKKKFNPHAKIIDMDEQDENDAAVKFLKEYIKIKNRTPVKPPVQEEVDVQFNLPNQPAAAANNAVLFKVTLKNHQEDFPKVRNAYTEYVKKLTTENPTMPKEQLSKYSPIEKTIPEKIENGVTTPGYTVTILRFKSMDDAKNFLEHLNKLNIEFSVQKITPSKPATPTSDAPPAAPPSPVRPSR
ncbi:MAG: hypothetical protein P4M12_06530 [Gammaproteobacteria bacterium]|nr:hypothetical protein [Gammaproteobacteria bacterium]